MGARFASFFKLFCYQSVFTLLAAAFRLPCWHTQATFVSVDEQVGATSGLPGTVDREVI